MDPMEDEDEEFEKGRDGNEIKQAIELSIALKDLMPARVVLVNCSYPI